MSDVVKNDVVKKIECDKLAAKVNNIDTSAFVLKTKYQADKAELEKKIPDVADLVKKTKLTELENKISDVSNWSTKTAVSAVENKISNVSGLVNKANYDIKISELEKKLTDHNHDKYITTPEFNTLAADAFNTRSAKTNLIKKADFNTRMSSIENKIAENKSKNVSIEDKLKKKLGENFILLLLGNISLHGGDGSQAYLIFQPMYMYFKLNANTKYISSWKSKGLSDESIKPPTVSDNSLTIN